MENVTWFKQSGFFFDGERRLYIDPWDTPDDAPGADLIFITHAHYDHFDKETIERIRKEDTVIVAPADVSRELEGSVLAIAPGQEHTVEGISFITVPAYNLNKDFHPRENNWVGYIFTLGGKRYYHAGDTDRVPEMKEVTADVALVPIGGTYTMDAKEAAAAVSEDIKPKLAVPMHYGFVVGKPEDGELFKELSTIPVEILNPRVPFGS